MVGLALRSLDLGMFSGTSCAQCNSLLANNALTKAYRIILEMSPDGGRKNKKVEVDLKT